MWVNTVLQGSAATYYIHGFDIYYLGSRQTVPSLGALFEGQLAAARHALLKHPYGFWCGLSDATNAIKRIQIGVQDAVHSSNTLNHFPECIAKRALLQGRQAIGTLSRITSVKTRWRRESVYPHNVSLWWCLSLPIYRAQQEYSLSRLHTVLPDVHLAVKMNSHSTLAKYTGDLMSQSVLHLGHCSRPRTQAKSCYNLLRSSSPFIQCMSLRHKYGRKYNMRELRKMRWGIWVEQTSP